ncbi:hypothetical protein [uncultured Mediterranean phage uvDeep-CGR2-KM21-C368]|nr:hypothetical protein [uncultured Mediterranean phage uvDeep-CGR2-KM21-C368]
METYNESNVSGVTDNITAYLLRSYQAANNRRELWVPTFEECYEYTLPRRESFYQETPGQPRTSKIYDETAVVGVQEFASRLQNGLVPAYTRWARLKSGTEVPEDKKMEIDKQLEIVSNYVFDVIQNSNFAQETHESFLDLTLGTGCLLVNEGDELNPIRFQAVPLTQMVLDTGHTGEVDKIFRVRRIPVKDILLLYPKATPTIMMQQKLEKDPEFKCTIIEAVYRNWDEKDETWHYCVIHKEGKEKIWVQKYKGIGSNPWVVFRWSKAAGEIYGRGPTWNALAAIKTCNLTIELILENAQMSISGLWQISDDGTINTDTINLVPGTVIPVSPGSAGLQPLQSPGKFDVAQLVLDDMRHNIKKALYNEMLGKPLSKTPMSATEVAERQADLARQIGAAYGRLQAEFINPVLKRVIYILKKQGRIELPTINGREVRIQTESPLGRQQMMQDVFTIDQYLGMLQQRFGPEMTNLMINGEATAEYLAKKQGIPLELIRTPEQKEEVLQRFSEIEQMRQQGQQQQGAEPVEQTTEPTEQVGQADI